MRPKWIETALVAGFLGAFALATLWFRRRNEVPRSDNGWPVNFAHRGASDRAPENTLEAFRIAVEDGAPGLELDVHLSRDGEVMVAHDDDVDRCTNGTGPLRNQSLEELRSLDAGYSFTRDRGGTFPYRGLELRIPKLEEVYDQFPGVTVNLDIKEKQPGIEETVLRVIEEAGAEDRTLVASQSRRIIRRFRKLAGGKIQTSSSKFEVGALLVLSWLRLERLLRPAYDALQVPVRHRGVEIVTPRFLDAAHDLGVRVDVWTIDEPDEMHRLLDLGADVVMTNKPEVLQRVLEQRRHL